MISNSLHLLLYLHTKINLLKKILLNFLTYCSFFYIAFACAFAHHLVLISNSQYNKDKKPTGTAQNTW